MSPTGSSHVNSSSCSCLLSILQKRQAYPLSDKMYQQLQSVWRAALESGGTLLFGAQAGSAEVAGVWCVSLSSGVKPAYMSSERSDVPRYLCRCYLLILSFLLSRSLSSRDQPASFIFAQLIHLCSTITLLCLHLCSTPAGFSLLRAPVASIRPVPVSQGVTTTKELGCCCGVWWPEWEVKYGINIPH